MSTSTRGSTLAVLCVLLVIGVAGPASGVAAASPLTDPLTGDGDETTDGTEHVDSSGDESGEAGSTDDATDGVDAADGDSAGTASADTDSDGQDSTAGDPDSGTPEERTSDERGLLDGVANATATGDANGTVDANLTVDAGVTEEADEVPDVGAGVDTTDAPEDGVEADVSAEVAEVADVGARASATDDGTTVDVSTSGGEVLDVDATVDATGDLPGLTAGASLNASIVDRAAAISWANSTGDRELASNGSGQSGSGADRGGADEADEADEGASEDESDAGDGDQDDAPGPLPDPAPVAGVGVAVVGSAAAARKGATALGVGPRPVGVRAAARAAVDRLPLELPRIVPPFGYSRHDESDPLEHDVRADLYEAVRTAPGVHLSGLHARTAVSLSSVRHHLRVLEDEDLVESELIRGKRRFFPAGADHTALTAALDEPATAVVLRTLAEVEPASVTELADRLDRDPSTISHHVGRLAEDCLVEREREGKAVRARLAPSTRRALDGADDGLPADASAD